MTDAPKSLAQRQAASLAGQERYLSRQEEREASNAKLPSLEDKVAAIYAALVDLVAVVSNLSPEYLPKCGDIYTTLRETMDKETRK